MILCFDWVLFVRCSPAWGWGEVVCCQGNRSVPTTTWVEVKTHSSGGVGGVQSRGSLDCSSAQRRASEEYLAL